MTFQVEPTAEAERDAHAILEWLLSQHAGNSVFSDLMAFEDSIGSLAQFPERCSLAPESGRFPFEVRQLLSGYAPHIYRILFTSSRNTVYVPHIRHARRQPAKH